MSNTDQLPALLAEPPDGLRIPQFPLTNPSSNQENIVFSLVIPTYNESQNIKVIVEQLSQILDEVLFSSYELIVVDDDSPDQTWKLAQQLIEQYPQLQVMRRQRERGLSSAVIRGWQVSRGEVLGVIDADLQHPPEVLVNLINEIEQGADLAVASRHVEGGGVSDWGVLRRFLSRGAQTLGLIILPQVVGRVSDPMSGYFLVKRAAISEQNLHPKGYKILLEVLGRGDVRQINEVGYVFQERQEGESKVTRKQYVDYVHHLLRLRSRGRVARLRQKIQLPFVRFCRFALVGLSGVFVDMAIFYLLSDPTALAWGVTRSKVISAEVAIINNFFWNDLWTFGDLSQRQPSWRKRLKRFIKFNLICLAGVVLNVLILNMLFNVFGVNRYVANLIAIAVVTLWNFWINLKLGWRVTEIK